MPKLKGKKALVTGGGRGIGRAIALALAREGADVAVTSRTTEEIESVANEVAELGGYGVAILADAMDREATRGGVRKAIDEFGHLDVLVNNVGGLIAPRGLHELLPLTHDDDLFDENLVLNLTTHYWATREALPQMCERKYGRIIYIGSGYAKKSGGTIAYSAAKHGIVGLTRSLAAQVAPMGVTVNCLCPGWTNTKLVDWDNIAAAYGTDPAGAKAMAESENIQKRVLEPEELGPMAALLCAEESGGITGQVISVDGGYGV